MNQDRFEKLITSWVELFEESDSALDLTATSLWSVIDWHILQAPPNVFQTTCEDRYLQIRVEMESHHPPPPHVLDSHDDDLEEYDLTADNQTVTGIPFNSEVETEGKEGHEEQETRERKEGRVGRDGKQLSSPTDAPTITLQSIRYKGCIDIILHPIYNVPCPYVRMYDANGQPASAEEIQFIIRTHRMVTKARERVRKGTGERTDGDRDKHASDNKSSSAQRDDINLNNDTDINGGTLGDGSIDGNYGSDDSIDIDTIGEPVEYMYEEHPYLLTPSLCLHVCGLGASLALISPLETANRVELGRSSSSPLSPLPTSKTPQRTPIETPIETPKGFVEDAVGRAMGHTGIKHPDINTTTGSSDDRIFDTTSCNNTNSIDNIDTYDSGNVGNSSNSSDNMVYVLRSDLYLLSWFAIVGPPIGIDIPLAFYKYASKLL